MPFGFPASFGGMRLRLLVAAIAVGLWVTAGLGHSVLLNQCYESRHADDRQPMVFGGVALHVITVVMWPLYASAIVLDPPDCKTIPVSNG